MSSQAIGRCCGRIRDGQPGRTGSTMTIVSPTLDVAVDDLRAVARAGEPFLIGRDPGCQLRVQSPLVSRRHAEVSWTGQGWLLRDLGSRNGTYVDGHRVETVPVGGSVVRLGSAGVDGPLVVFGAAPPAPPGPRPPVAGQAHVAPVARGVAVVA